MYTAAGITGKMQATGYEWGAALYKTSDGMVGVAVEEGAETVEEACGGPCPIP